MTSKHIKDSNPENSFTVERQFSKAEFKKEITKAENGPFLTVEESIQKFEAWLRKKEKK